MELLLDTSSLMYRAFFALPKTITDDEGRSVNAVRGFLDMTSRLFVDRRARSVVAVLDADWRPAFRVEAYSGYKSERSEDPPELPWQFTLLDEVLDAAGIPRAWADGYEADDVIAVLAEKVKGRGRAAVVTGDRDLLCLVRDPHVSLLFPVKGTSEMKEFGEAAVLEAYGIPPSLYCEFAMLRGDPSDGLPGVAGIGPKRAAALLDAYGSVAGILDHVDDQPPKQRDALVSAREYLTAVESVVRPATDAGYTVTEAHDPDRDALEELGRRHNLESPVKRLLEALGSA